MNAARLVSMHARAVIRKRHPREKSAGDRWGLYRLLKHGSFAKRRGGRHG